MIPPRGQDTIQMIDTPPFNMSQSSGLSFSRESKSDNRIIGLKRFFLLLLIIVVCGFVLWQIYEVLIEEENYLGVVKYSPSEFGKFNKYAVSTDAAPCAKIGKDLLAKGGHAVDAAIGTLICMGVVLPNSLGLGGGCLMTIYDNTTKMGTVIDGRETAPDYATENMFAGDPLSSSRGPLSVGVPGELAAYWEAHQRFGRLSWSELFDASIEMAENGFQTVEHLSFALRDLSHSKYITPPLAKLLTNNATGEYYSEGEIMYQRELAQTLRRIRDKGVSEFYDGPTGQMFIDDLRKQGGKMTIENLRSYKADVKKAAEFRLNDDLRVLTQPVPGSGVVLGIILRIMQELGYYKNLKPKSDFASASLYYHHLTEAFKFAYAQRAALEDDPDDPTRLNLLLNKISSDEFIKDIVSKITDDKTHPSAYYGGLEYFQEDHGTAHTSVIDNEGNSVAITTSVNLYFGSGLVSPSTGIIYNDVMDDFVSPNLTNKFQLPPTKYNHIRPGKRPLSSMAPSVFIDGHGNPKLIIGASGGSKITTAIAMVALRNLFFNENIKTAIDSSRIHHQFLPDKIMFEANFPPEILSSLAHRGHNLKVITGRSSVVMAVACDYKNSSKVITANSDYRKGGTVAGT
uniref:Gamma-glutamyltranspeptidase 1 n=1 Tax=Aceria tosichella TaxID=561515 RepID=A0A6G1SD81_9ACAR